MMECLLQGKNSGRDRMRRRNRGNRTSRVNNRAVVRRENRIERETSRRDKLRRKLGVAEKNVKKC